MNFALEKKTHYFLEQKINFRSISKLARNPFSMLSLLMPCIKELEPCLKFLGYRLAEQKAKCIEKDQEGGYHRTPMDPGDLENIFSKPFSQKELLEFEKTKNEVMQSLLKNSINHSE